MNLKTNRATASLLLLPLLLLGVSVTQAQSEPLIFTPNSISLFWPGTNAGAANGYFGEWELQNNMPVISGTNAGLDVNIMGAWSNGFTGQGVTIAIVDTGVDGRHPDLNYANSLSWDFRLNTQQNLANRNYLGYPRSTNNTHGIECAGIAAGNGYGIGIVGAAPDAKISSLAYLGLTPDSSGKSDADKLSAIFAYQGQTDLTGKPNPYLPVKWKNTSWTNGPPIRVKSHSYGHSGGMPYVVSNISDALKISNALVACDSNGIINVFAAGNDRYTGRYSNGVPMDNGPIGTQDAERQQIRAYWPHCINVSALGSDGKYANYSSYGANVFVTAPSDSSPGLFSIPSTDLPGPIGDNLGNLGPDKYFSLNSGASISWLTSYYSSFGGTSEACPIVAGIMALGVEADPFLTPRMAQHLLALTSRQVDVTNSDWITNANGYAFNNNYGFGLIDATAFTTAAAYVYDAQLAGWNPLSEEKIITKTFKPNLCFVSNNVVSTNLIMIPFTMTNKYQGLSNEYIQVSLKITGFQTNLNDYLNGKGSISGDISALLISPNGTQNMLFYTDRNVGNQLWQVDSYRAHWPQLNWTYTSYAYYGENPNGVWRLYLQNNSTNTVYTNNLKVESVTVNEGIGSFDDSCLGQFPFANGTNPVLR